MLFIHDEARVERTHLYRKIIQASDSTYALNFALFKYQLQSLRANAKFNNVQNLVKILSI